MVLLQARARLSAVEGLAGRCGLGPSGRTKNVALGIVRQLQQCAVRHCIQMTASMRPEGLYTPSLKKIEIVRLSAPERLSAKRFVRQYLHKTKVRRVVVYDDFGFTPGGHAHSAGDSGLGLSRRNATTFPALINRFSHLLRAVTS